MSLKHSVLTILFLGLASLANATTPEPGTCAYHLTHGLSVKVVGNEIRIETREEKSISVSANPQGGLVEVTEPQLLAKAYTEEKLIVVKQGTTMTVVGNKDGQLRELNRVDLSNFLDKSAIYAGVPASIVKPGEKFDVIGFTIEAESDTRSHYVQFQVVIRTSQALHLLSFYSDYEVRWNHYEPIRNLKVRSLQFASEIDRVSAPWELKRQGRFGLTTQNVVTVHTKDGEEHIVYRQPTQTVRQGWSPDSAHLVEIKP